MTDYSIPGPHSTFRQQYRFPQQWATPQAEYNVLRATRKGSGSQLTYIGYEGGPQNAPTQLRWLTGVTGLSGLGAWRWTQPPRTVGELRARVQEVIIQLRANPTQLVTANDVHGAVRSLPAAQFADALQVETDTILAGRAADDPVYQTGDQGHFIRMLDSVEQQVAPWYRKRVVGLTLGGLIVTASTFAAAYHGYKRNRSVGWAAWWGLMGMVFPVITPAVALAQGYGKRKGR